jgi:hypothetical protein
LFTEPLSHTMPRVLPTMPPVTDEHRLAAFKAMRWVDCTFEEAMAHPVRGHVIECRAAAMRKQQWQQAQRWTRTPWPPVPAPRRSQPYQRTHLQDVKRAAAGDRDDD